LEDLGDFWHGCPWLPQKQTIGNTQETLMDRYAETMARMTMIENAGYKVVSIWGREFRKILRYNPGLEKGTELASRCEECAHQ
jgi:hypothetical protein